MKKSKIIEIALYIAFIFLAGAMVAVLEALAMIAIAGKV